MNVRYSANTGLTLAHLSETTVFMRLDLGKLSDPFARV
jgi:hypothetical protein